GRRGVMEAQRAGTVAEGRRVVPLTLGRVGERGDHVDGIAGGVANRLDEVVVALEEVDDTRGSRRNRHTVLPLLPPPVDEIEQILGNRADLLARFTAEGSTAESLVEDVVDSAVLFEG